MGELGGALWRRGGGHPSQKQADGGERARRGRAEGQVRHLGVERDVDRRGGAGSEGHIQTDRPSPTRAMMLGGVWCGFGSRGFPQALLREGRPLWCLLGKRVIGTAAGLQGGVCLAGFGG